MLQQAISCDWSEERKQKVLKRVGDAKVVLNAWVPFYGHLTLGLKPRIARPSDRVLSAAVSVFGELILNVDYVEQQTDAKVRGLLCHEVTHPGLLCFQRQGNRHAVGVDLKTGQVVSLWNLAHDYAIDPEIQRFIDASGQQGNIVIPDATINPAWDGWSAEQIYEELLEMAQKNGRAKGQQGQSQCQGQSPGQGQGQGSGEGGDMLLCPLQGNARSDDARADLSEEGGGNGRNGQSDNSFDLFSGENVREALDLGSATADEWRVRLLSAVQVHQQMGKGTLPGSILKLVKELTESRTEWKQLLSMWAGENGVLEDYTYRRPSRRSHSVGEYMPDRTTDGVDDITVAWDSSGSMNGREGEVLGHMQGICDDLGVGLRVIICDTTIQGDVRDVTDALELLEQLGGVPGGGGSDFRPLFQKLEDEAYRGVVIAFTDGHIEVPKSKPELLKDVLWVLTRHDVNPTVHYGSKRPWGQVLRIDEKGFGRLEAR